MNFKQLTRLLIDQNEAFLKSNQQVALGMSGGVDSTALFHVFCEFVKLKKISNFIILHVNYRLRGKESEDDFLFCQELAGQYSVPFFSLDCQNLSKDLKKQESESIQVWARRVRHSWFKEYYDKGYSIALAHNANDVAETVLFRLARGSQPENLAGMSRQDLHIWRPLIAILRKDIVQAMTEAKYPWREDSSNLSRKYARNQIRHDVLGVLEEVSSGATQRIADIGHQLSRRCYNSHEKEQNSSVELDVALADHNLSRQKVEAVRSFLSAGVMGQSIDLGSGFILSRKSNDNKKVSHNLQSQSAARAVQHLHGIDGPRVSAVTSGECQLFVAKPAIFTSQSSRELMTIKIESKNDKQSNEVLVKVPGSDDKVSFAEQASSFKFKDLMQKWKIAVSDRMRFVVITTKHTKQGQLVKLFQSGKNLDGAFNG